MFLSVGSIIVCKGTGLRYAFDAKVSAVLLVGTGAAGVRLSLQQPGEGQVAPIRLLYSRPEACIMAPQLHE